MKEEVKINNEQEVNDIKYEKEVQEIIDKANKIKKESISNEEVKKEILEHIDFLNKLDEINVSAKDYRVIVTLGEEELVYDNGEFYLCNTKDSRVKRKKIGKSQAKDIYIEYFIRYILNPILEERKIINMVNVISKDIEEPTKEKNKTKTNIKEKSKSKTKSKVKTKEEVKTKKAPKVEIKKEEKKTKVNSPKVR